MAYPPTIHDVNSGYGYEHPSTPLSPPPPPDLREPMLAPRPHRVDPSVPQNMIRTLDEQLQYPQQQQSQYDYRRPSPAPGPFTTPGFAAPRQPQQYSQPPPQAGGWSPWGGAQTGNTPAPYGPPPGAYSNPQSDVAQSFANLSLSPTIPGSAYGRTPSAAPHSRAPSAAPSSAGGASLTAQVPTIPVLTSALPTIQQPNHDPALKISWVRDILSLVDRLQQPAGAMEAANTPPGPITINDPQLLRLVQVAVPTVLQVAALGTQVPMPTYVAEAVYFRATFAASGAYPDHVKLNPRQAFRDYEASARAGHHIAWFKIGRDYENFKDVVHAKDCFERGVKLGVEACLYRMGMAHLMGQLGLPVSIETAIPLLLRAANLSSLGTPQPAYVYALILQGEFRAIPEPIPSHLLTPHIPPSSSPSLESRKHLERSAYLHFAPAQYKLGHAYEFAVPPFEFDPLVSVEWYSKASQQGEAEADMALSKWFLCGAEGAFEKDEGLAYIFAEKAAGKGLASAEFAMGYYCEVGIGRPGAAKDIPKAVSWYEKAQQHGNEDAGERLQALQGSVTQSLSRQEHDAITESKLVRTRTQAKQKSEAAGGPSRRPRANGDQIMQTIRQDTVNVPGIPPVEPAPSDQPPASSYYGAPPPQQQQRPQHRNESPHRAGQPSARPQQPQQLPHAQRYSLADPGATPPTSRPGSSAAGPMNGSRRPSAQADPATPPARKGASTFAEMGIPTAKAEDEKCIIM